MKLGIPGLALVASATLLGVSVAAAQTAPPQPPAMTFADPPHKNLKVLPADMSRAQLISTMKFFAQSLGVRCTFCHVGTEGQPLSTFDFPADTKPEKGTARAMIRMVQHINADYLPAATGLPDAKVTCFSCHRGAKKPATEVPAGVVLVPPPPGAAPPKP
jgi:hypothetical protein